MSSREPKTTSSRQNKKSTTSIHPAAPPIAELELRPHDHPLMLLGSYEKDHQPKGFRIEFYPEPETSDLINAEITSRTLPDKSQYLLYIANDSNKTLNAAVWQL